MNTYLTYTIYSLYELYSWRINNTLCYNMNMYFMMKVFMALLNSESLFHSGLSSV